MLGFPDLDFQKKASKIARRDSLTLDQV